MEVPISLHTSRKCFCPLTTYWFEFHQNMVALNMHFEEYMSTDMLEIWLIHSWTLFRKKWLWNSNEVKLEKKLWYLYLRIDLSSWLVHFEGPQFNLWVWAPFENTMLAFSVFYPKILTSCCEGIFVIFSVFFIKRPFNQFIFM